LQSEPQSLLPGPDKAVTRDSIETELVERLNVDRTRAGKRLAAVGRRFLFESMTPPWLTTALPWAGGVVSTREKAPR
jgi:hypothetical protein